eukprot:CAMPEP_0171132956 /NCGR_PEP_ID=MMETSP0766_2-20121228/125435_1 /TAXON_ID=439317 /ORGANISM="Gambierdiscus australes, Strain CAWD 149" /LENGTH=451 /DNA_ID=CAMNT_0011596311 /DNA_START=16 /DNA_END=1371 /DNA_ORIENTATION=-
MSMRLGHVLKLWNWVTTKEKVDIFGHITLATDGGLGDITPGKLMYSSQYIYAAMSVLFIVMNTIFVTLSDTKCVFEGVCGAGRQSAVAACVKSRVTDCSSLPCFQEVVQSCQTSPEVPQPFMLTRMLLFETLPAERLIAIIEFFCLWFLIVRMVWLIFMTMWTRLSVYRWVCVVQIFWQTIPSLSCFSLMRLLYYVTPSVVGTEAYYAVVWTMERVDFHGKSFVALWPMVRYVLTRLFCLIVGFDAFLFKFRLASSGILHNEPTSVDVIHAVLFLFQMLGVVNLTWFVRERLFLFIFGSENGDMTNEQKARQIVWNAYVAQKIFEKLGFFKFLIVMLGFDDYDFQVLVMERKDSCSGSAGSFMRRQQPMCPQSHNLKLGRTPLPRCDVCQTQFWPFTELWGCRQCNFDACEKCKLEPNLASEKYSSSVRGSRVEEEQTGMEAWLLSVAINA